MTRTGRLAPVYLQHGSKCTRCGAAIIWATTVHDRRMPLDALPHVDGTIELTQYDDGTPPSCRVLTGMFLDLAEIGSLYVSHRATCPKKDTAR